MTKFTTLLFIFLIFLFAGCAEKPTKVESTGDMNGRVLDDRTGEGIENAIVSILTVGDKITDNSGFYQFADIEEGTYSITAEKTGYISQTKQIEVEVNKTKEVNFQLMKDEPVLSITPTQINFGITNIEENVSITNIGTGSLIWSTSESLDWLSVSPSSGSVDADNPTNTTVSVTRSGLSQGNYEGEVVFTSNGGDDTVKVQMVVVPSLVVSESSLNFGAELTSLSFTISNSGGGILDWTITEQLSWLIISPTSGTTEVEDDVISVLVDRTGVAAGDYSGNITVASNGGSANISVLMRVPVPPQLVVSPTSLDFGNSTTNMTINIINGGDEELSWQVASNKSWLTTFPSAGVTNTETDEISVTINRSGLEVGNYSGNLAFTSNGGDLNVPVAMEVTPVILSVTPSTLDFGSEETQLTLSVSNSGNGELNWSLTPNQDWITADPTSGTITTTSVDIMVTVDRTDLEPNTYNGSISIESNGGNKNVNITMTVLEKTNIIEHFDDLDSWVNTTNSTYDDAWIIDENGFIGSCAKSVCGGYGYGDMLSQTFNFPKEVTAKFVAKNKYSSGSTKVYFIMDDSILVSWPGNNTNWTELSCKIPAGEHEIKIKSDYAGTIYIDELEITED